MIDGSGGKGKLGAGTSVHAPSLPSDLDPRLRVIERLNRKTQPSTHQSVLVGLGELGITSPWKNVLNLATFESFAAKSWGR